MGMEALLLAFFPQRQTLVNAEAVLLINNDQRQTVELHLFLKNGVSADDHLYLATGDGLLLRLAGFPFLFAGQPAYFDAQRREPLAEVIGVLFRQQFGRRHQRYLFAVSDRPQRCEGGNQRFTGADVALYQTHHRHIKRHIAFNFGGDSLLCAGWLKGQGGQQLVFECVVRTECQGMITLGAGA